MGLFQTGIRTFKSINAEFIGLVCRGVFKSLENPYCV